jgi:hypothetical protein
MKDVERAKIYLTRIEAAEFIELHGLPCSPRTLTKLACVGGGPNYRRYGRNAIYTEVDLEAWMEEKLNAEHAKSIRRSRSRKLGG